MPNTNDYLVLARKYRPQDLASMVGQEHVCETLANALDSQQLHQAYLFTGTSGVGKTSVARILAKALNCEQGISTTPCGKCSACLDISAGKFIDLIEVDAASRTKVEDTRELLENVQYAPTRGRFKIYLIDEVHMLSNHSFNALLKTLEEPPPHVKFLLATTDRDKLPKTILSRCLQFNLTRLSVEQISQQLEHILSVEKITFEKSALIHLAKAANGSMRDALSLLDQAIAYTQQNINEQKIRQMLGFIEQEHVLTLMNALSHNDSKKAMHVIQRLAEQATDFNHVLEELLTLLHQIAVLQAVGQVEIDLLFDTDVLAQLTQQFGQEDIQLLYQIALIARTDLPLAPTARIGFEMTILRMMAFRPVVAPPPPTTDISSAQISIANQPESKETHDAQQTVTSDMSETIQSVGDDLQWITVCKQLTLSGMTKALAEHCTLQSKQDGQLHLLLDANQAPLLTEHTEVRLAQALADYLKQPIKLHIQLTKDTIDTPAAQAKQESKQQLQAAEQRLGEDDKLQAIIQEFSATIMPDSIKPTSQQADLITTKEEA